MINSLHQIQDDISAKKFVHAYRGIESINRMINNLYASIKRLSAIEKKAKA